MTIVVLWRRFVSGLRAVFHRAQMDRELDEELREYVRMAKDRNVRAGMNPDEALRAARAHVGSIEAVKEGVRDVGWESIVESLVQDLRFGLRMLSRNVGFTLVAVLALALGIGVNTAVFTAYKAMVARPLDARDPGELVNLALTSQAGDTTFTFSNPDYEAYRDTVHSFSGLIAFTTEHLTLSNAGDVVSQRASAAESQLGRLGLLSSGTSNAEFASTFAVSENYFKVLGVSALRGRTFDAIGIPGLADSPAVLISENYWQRRFRGDPAVPGKTIHLNGVPVTIVGITPHDFVGTNVAVPDFWLPLSLEPLVHADRNWLRDRESQRLRLFARLAPGVSIGQAQAEMTSVANHLRAQHDPRSESAGPATVLAWAGSPFPLPLNRYSGLRLTILLIMSAAAMVLIVACANVGSLQLARARSRQNELHTRLSLGASRLRVIRQLLTESALLGLLAGAAALLFTWGLLKVLVTLAAEALPIEYGTLVFDVTPDLGIFIYVLAISLLAGVLFGLAPALESSRSALSPATRASTAPTRTRRIQDVLVATQVALSLVLLIAGSLLIRSSLHSLHMDPGYDARHVVDFNFQFPEAAKYTPGRKAAVVSALRTRLAALPGVAAITSAQPPDNNPFRTAAVSLDGEDSSPHNVRSTLHYRYVQANYFQTLGIPLFLGRGFQPESGQADRSVILSESAARQIWPGQNPVGRNLRLGPTDERVRNSNAQPANESAYRVIGVVRDTRGVQFDGSDSKQAYLLLPDDRLDGYPILIRTQSDPAEVVRAIDPLISSIDRDLLGTAFTLEEALRQSGPFIVSSLSAMVASTVGLLGLFLALVGIHGTVSYVVVLRTREVGIRIAVGAQGRDILRLMLRESTRPVLAGLLVGMLLSVGASFVLRSVLYGLNTIDGVSFVGVSLLFLAIALLAAHAPSRRALSVDPMVALRYE